jgi:hypothetical protein
MRANLMLAVFEVLGARGIESTELLELSLEATPDSSSMSLELLPGVVPALRRLSTGRL